MAIRCQFQKDYTYSQLRTQRNDPVPFVVHVLELPEIKGEPA